MQENLDDLVRSGFKHERDIFFTALIVSTGIVVVGLIFEEAKLWFPTDKPQLDMAKGVFSPSPLIKWRNRIEILGWMLIVIGVIGEGAFEGATSIADGLLQDFNGILLKAAQREAGDAATSATTAREGADAAYEAAGKAQGKADAVSKQADELNRDLLAAKTQLNAVDAKRAELETSLKNLAVCTAPRVIPVWIAGGKSSIDPLKPFAREAIIEFVPDAETRRAAFSISKTLREAGWKINELVPLDGLRDGVEVQPYEAPWPKDEKNELFEWYKLHSVAQESMDAATTLVDFLHSYNWQAILRYKMWAEPGVIPVGGLRILVGLYPAVTYVIPPAERDLASAVLAIGQADKEDQEKIEKDADKQDEEAMKHMTPEHAMALKARVEQYKKEQAMLEERSSGPCKPLAPLMLSPR